MKALIEGYGGILTGHIFVQDSSSLVGAGLTGLSAGSAGLTAYVHCSGVGYSEALTIEDGVLGTSGGFFAGGLSIVACDATNMPGVYEIYIGGGFAPPTTTVFEPNPSMVVWMGGAANMVPVVMEYQFDWRSRLMAAPLTMPVTAPTTTSDCTVDKALGFALAQSAFKREQTAATETVYAIDSTTPMLKSDKSDNGTTFTRGKYY